MNESVFKLLNEGREWSWSVIGLIAIFLGLFLRAFLLSNVLRHVRDNNRKWYRRTIALYRRRSFLGWLFFIISMAGIMLLWRFDTFLVRFLNYSQWAIVLTCFFVASVFLHLRAYARSLIEAGQEQPAQEKGI